MNAKRLDAIIDMLPSAGIPMADLLVTRNGETVYRHSSGYTDKEGKRPTSPRDIYWIYSNTKIATCIAAARLLEEGRLSLTDRLDRYIPAFRDVTVRQADGTTAPPKAPITVEHLFTMSAGLDYNCAAPAIREAVAAGGDTQSIVSAMAKSPLNFEPGSTFRYSLCHDVLAAVCEVVTDLTFSEYMKKVMLDPLGMEDTGFRPTEEQKTRFAAMYSHDGGTMKAIPRPVENAFAFTPSYDSGGAGLFSTTEDYAKLVTAIALGGTAKNGYRLLSPETVRLLAVNRITDEGRRVFSNGRLYGYGWGLCGRVHMDPLVSLSASPRGEFGWDGAAGALNMMDPENGIALYFSTHVHGSPYLYNKVHPAIINAVYEGAES